MQTPISTPAPEKPDREDDTAEAERVRQGEIVMRTRGERIIFAAGLAAPVVVLVVLWLTHVL